MFSMSLVSDIGILSSKGIKFILKIRTLKPIDKFYDFTISNKQEVNLSYYKHSVSPKKPNIRMCELEVIKSVWADINNFNFSFTGTKENLNSHKLNIKETINKKVEDVFHPFFKVIKILVCDMGYFIFKIILQAVETGIISRERLGIKIVIKQQNKKIRNEVKKNGLLYENSNSLELRLNDYLICYISHTK